MKTKNNFLFLVIFSVITFFSLFASCHDDGDTTKPEIDLIEPEEDAVLQIGDDVHFEMEVSDNEMLSSYKVEIHPNLDGHTHSRTTRTTDFYFEETWSLAGKKNAYIDHHEIDIPEGATPGHYHLMVYCTDAAGNEAILTRDIELSHEGEEHHDE
ncbi:MAG: DUF4625 domain-containing protein [Mediterranea sp.]|jgi:hypothetical protein|nr:DUF4625 domain-containing protein [Mediterranea sp.]